MRDNVPNVGIILTEILPGVQIVVLAASLISVPIATVWCPLKPKAVIIAVLPWIEINSSEH